MVLSFDMLSNLYFISFELLNLMSGIDKGLEVV